MKQTTIEKFDKSEIEIIDNLVKIGINRKEALVILSLIRKPDSSVKEISYITDLRQSEISITCKALIERKWISSRLENKNGKGRHFYIYTLVYDINDIIEEYKRNIVTIFNKLQQDIYQE